jgi:murein DD-endopeptidase MepM/ murein hydrolase activator NlpD
MAIVMRRFLIFRRCRFAIGFLPLIAGLVCAPDVSSAGTEQRAEPPAPLAVRYKEAPEERVDNGPFTLLAAFPEAIARRIVEREVRRARPRPRTFSAALMQGGGNPLPRRNEVLSSGFGMRRHPLLGGWRPHLGVDLAAPTGTPVYATADGVVSAAGWRGGYGLSITLEHRQSLETRYGHMSRLNVARGQSVQRGSVIGWVGSTWLSTGPHLHYETRLQGRAVNPLPYIRRKK